MQLMLRAAAWCMALLVVMGVMLALILWFD